jgi:hypothetical protein
MKFAFVHEGIDDPDQHIDYLYFSPIGSVGGIAY